MPTDQQKWIISIISAILFYIIALPQTYECITNPIVESVTGIELEKKGKPTTALKNDDHQERILASFCAGRAEAAPAAAAVAPWRLVRVLGGMVMNALGRRR